MKIHLKNEEVVQQILYALLGLAFLTALLVSTKVRSETTVISTDANIVMTGEISSIEGDGFALKHDNGLTLISLKDIDKKNKDALADANVIKVGNIVRVQGEMDKGAFNKPVVKAENIAVVDAAKPVGTTQVIPEPVTPGVTVVPATP